MEKDNLIDGLIAQAESIGAGKAEVFFDLERNGKKYWAHVFVKAEDEDEE